MSNTPNVNNQTPSFFVIDKNGLVFNQQGAPLKHPEELKEFFDNLYVDESRCFKTVLLDKQIIIEVYDEPLIATQIKLNPQESSGILTTNYGHSWKFDLTNLFLDEWDRFHGNTINNIPFVLSSEAQDQFFNQLEEFDDDSITLGGKQIEVKPFWTKPQEAVSSESFWSERYRLNNHPWDLGVPAVGLTSLLPKIKLPSSRILVLGGGGGHDAAHFAQQGHHVTLVDISPEAIERAKKNYGTIPQLQFLQVDLFEAPTTMYGQFDLIFEHTCFCAIDPTRRNALVQQWRRLLHDTGLLMGVFFIMPTQLGPPFGSSEWEIHQRLKKNFHTLVWQRLRDSIAPRLGKELLIYMQKK